MSEPVQPIELLRELSRTYRHLAAEHEREREAGSTRRRLEGEMDAVRERAERVLSHWVSDAALEEAWRRHILHGGDEPEEPALSPPPVFRGRSDVGQHIEVRWVGSGTWDVLVDGALAKEGIAPRQLAPREGGGVQIDEFVCREEFAASEEAVSALRAYLEREGEPPPRRYARALYEDGLIDLEFGLTARGSRRLREPPAEAAEEAEEPGAPYCVLVADAGRARILTLETDRADAGAAFELAEVADVTDPEQRARDRDLLSESRPGLYRSSPQIPQHGVSDRREHHRREIERRHAERIVDEALRTARRYRHCRVIVAAPPALIGMLRPVLRDRARRGLPGPVREYGRDLTWVAAPAIHDALAEAGLLPPRHRRAPQPIRGPTRR